MSKDEKLTQQSRIRTEPTGYQTPRGIELLQVFAGQGASSVCFSPVEQMLAGGNVDHTVKVWDLNKGALVLELKGHTDEVLGVIFDPTGRNLISAGKDQELRIWDIATGEQTQVLSGHTDLIISLAVNSSKQMLASGSSDGEIRLWDLSTGSLLRVLNAHGSPTSARDMVMSLAFDSNGEMLVSGSSNGVSVWETESGHLLHTLATTDAGIYTVAFAPLEPLVASGGFSRLVEIWHSGTGRLLRTLEGHTQSIADVAFSRDGRILTTRGANGELRFWSCETWETVGAIATGGDGTLQFPGLVFHPRFPLMATISSEKQSKRVIQIWGVDCDLLAARRSKEAPSAIHHTTGKIVIVGDSGVGKTGLGWRLTQGEFREHSSTHGQQFWVLNQLGMRRLDGTECEAILWDLAGQPDYRLTHALFVDDADLALVVFDPTDSRDPLHGVEFWLKQLKSARVGQAQTEGSCPLILVGARTDRGDARLTEEELNLFCRQREIAGGYVATSAKEGLGLADLLQRMKDQIPWEQKSATVTTITFKRIKEYVLALKQDPKLKRVIVTIGELRGLLEKTADDWAFTDSELVTAIGHLANYGYVHLLRTSKGESRVLLSPELLNNLAASLVLEARRNPKGLGSLEEKRLLSGAYEIRELEGLTKEEADILLDSAALLFLKHNICFRETDPLTGRSYLVFPELINLKKPLLEDEVPTDDGAGYMVRGAVENVYASLVVLLGYTQTFTRTDQWRNQARYEVGDGLICGFRLDAESEGELDCVLYFGKNVGSPVRTLFQGLFESFLARHNLTVLRFEPQFCHNCRQPLDRSVVRTRLREGKQFAFCNDCGEKLVLGKADEPIQLSQEQQSQVETQRRLANLRTRFEQAIFRVQAYVKDQAIAVPACFISYAWGDKSHERWVENNLATDLQKSGIEVLLDRWENARIGANVMRFMERIEECDKLVVVGTPAYRRKYSDQTSEKGHVLAAEGQMIALRKLGQSSQWESVLPVLLDGDERSSFPLWLQGHVYADFRDQRHYFMTAFDLILSMYEIAPHEKAVADLRESLRGSEVR